MPPLQKDQIELLIKLVEADRKAPKQKFLVLEDNSSDLASLRHDGLIGLVDPLQVYMGDLDILHRAGLISLNKPYNRLPNFDITPEGYNYYEKLTVKVTTYEPEMTKSQILNLVLGVIAQFEGEGRNTYVEDTKIAQKIKWTIHDVRNYLDILKDQGKIKSANSHDGYRAMLTPIGRISLENPQYHTSMPLPINTTITNSLVSTPETKKLRDILSKSFSDDEIKTLCFDYFPDVHDDFSAGMRKSQMIQALLEHCRKKNLLDTLTRYIKTERPDISF